LQIEVVAAFRHGIYRIQTPHVKKRLPTHCLLSSAVSRRTIVRSAALASNVVASMPMVFPCTNPASASRFMALFSF
jgi:hypothetical protein